MLKPCRKVGCVNLTRETYCELHKINSENRPSSHKRGYGSRWQKARKSFLMSNPICVSCGRLAEVVDHIKAHKGDAELFWDNNNWQALCSSCHSKKTVREDMGRWY